MLDIPPVEFVLVIRQDQVLFLKENKQQLMTFDSQFPFRLSKRQVDFVYTTLQRYCQ